MHREEENGHVLLLEQENPLAGFLHCLIIDCIVLLVYGFMGRSGAITPAQVCCDQQMSDAKAWQRYALLGEAAVGATKICCD